MGQYAHWKLKYFATHVYIILWYLTNLIWLSKVGSVWKTRSERDLQMWKKTKYQFMIQLICPMTISSPLWHKRNTSLWYNELSMPLSWINYITKTRPNVDRYSGVIMSAMASLITSVTIICSNICSGAEQRKHQNSASLSFVRGIHRWPVVSRTKGQWPGKCFHLMTSSWIRVYTGLSFFVLKK